MSDLCDEQVIHDNIYANTYSLWGNSKYYDIKNLSPQNFANRNGTIGSEISQEKYSRWCSYPAELLQAPEPPDRLNRKTVVRDSLFENPEIFNNQPLPIENPPYNPFEDSSTSSTSFDWTQFYWHKATQACTDLGQGPSKGRKRQVLGPNNIQKKIDKMLAKPVKMPKAESMMQKMGWQGGALGRCGDGIVEPLAPNSVYVGNNAKTKIGFGQSLLQQRLLPPAKEIKKNDSRQLYEMNVLLNIFEFVKNNAEVELLFDKDLRKDERKKIHNLVQYKLCSKDITSVYFNSPAEMDLVMQICDKNCYNLHTRSFGTYPLRQLSLFKIAPSHVYLIIPDKLKAHNDALFSEAFKKRFLTDHGDEILEIEIEERLVKEVEELEPEEETNPFLISITRNLKKNSECQEEEEALVAPEEPEDPEEALPEMSVITTKIVKCFTEFAEDKKYSQLKFLGPFTEEEIAAINDFIVEAIKYLNKEACPYVSVFKRVAFEINEDCTGNTVIYKRPV